MRRRLRRSQLVADTGAAAVEFAIISVFLLVLLFGVLQYGLFFFQLATTEDALRSAARRVEIGAVTDCAIWEAAALDEVALGSATAEASWEPVDPTASAILRGDQVTVSIRWRPIRIGAGLIPFPSDPERTSSTQITVDQYGTALMWTDPTQLGCPL